LALALLLTTACRAAAPPGAASSGGTEPADAPRTLLATTRACLGEARREWVLRNAAEWRTWLASAGCGAASVPEPDFRGRVVLAVADWPGPSGCYAVRIASVARNAEGGVVVTVHRHVPARGDTCTAEVVHPAHAVLVDDPGGPIAWEWAAVQEPVPEAAP